MVDQRIYRFMPYDSARVQFALDSKLWFSKASAFNDPWDCAIHVMTVPRLSYSGKQCLRAYHQMRDGPLKALLSPPDQPFEQPKGGIR